MSFQHQDTLQGIAFTLFFLLVVLPLGVGIIRYATNFPNNSLSGGIALLEQGIIPWWIGLATASPILFVIVAGFLVAIGADEVL